MLFKGGFGLVAQTLRESGSAMYISGSLSRLIKKGKQTAQKILSHKKVKVETNQLERIDKCRGQCRINRQDVVVEKYSPFARYVQKYAVRSLASELRRRTAFQFRNGRIPTFAFVSLGLAVSQNQNDNADISSEIREVFKDREVSAPSILTVVQKLSLGTFEFGQLIGQGCNAAVYEAKLKDLDTESDITVLSDGDEEESQNELSFVEDHFSEVQTLAVQTSLMEEFTMVTELENEDSDIEIISEDAEENASDTSCSPATDYDLAVKMMFNYDVESNAEQILHAMMKEVVPARLGGDREEADVWQNGNRVRLKNLPPHPNIVDMVGMFVDPVPGGLGHALENFPHALPPRLNPEGLGRNMTLFVVMKKYDMTLREYLACNNLSTYNRCLLLLQLLEGAVHLGQHQVAHRDLKSNNILISEQGIEPSLVISDFGCCHADPEYGMELPYFTSETDKGGNQALMPPEISGAVPGRDVWLDYTKADLWTVGTLVYEIFGEENPFSGGGAWSQHLDSRTYMEGDLPSLPDSVPEPIRRLTSQILRRNPRERPSAEMAANFLHLYILFPDWFEDGKKPTVSMATESILLVLAKHILQQHMKGGNCLMPSDMTKLSFFKRLNLNNLLHVLKWYHSI
ncbi:hypothetical protein FSP39_013147 [Pinctada imbricata]|uniref:non-specific serine/threonine protein kinase n=1 Tax=Pinctada imbricata TaxID=66713 RepID=A0AA88YID2_PINIB|nr:hypothetical protein FSP39_013147 [Pinctada imbricata]